MFSQIFCLLPIADNCRCISSWAHVSTRHFDLIIAPILVLWALASSQHPPAILNMFGLIMIETTSRGCFNHAQNNHVSTMIHAMHCLM